MIDFFVTNKDIIYTCISFACITLSLIINRALLIHLTVFFEFALSNIIVHKLISSDDAGGLMFYFVTAGQGLFNIVLATFVFILFLSLVKSKSKDSLVGGKSSILIGLYYYCLAFYQLGMLVESMQFSGVSGYPLELFGLFGMAEGFYDLVIVLILTTMAFSLGNKNGRIIRGIGNLRNLINFGNKANTTYRQGCNHITNSKRG